MTLVCKVTVSGAPRLSEYSSDSKSFRAFFNCTDETPYVSFCKKYLRLLTSNVDVPTCVNESDSVTEDMLTVYSTVVLKNVGHFLLNSAIILNFQ